MVKKKGMKKEKAPIESQQAEELKGGGPKLRDQRKKMLLKGARYQALREMFPLPWLV